MATPRPPDRREPPVHRLGDAAFAALAAGRPDRATIAELRRAHLSRHLLLLRGIVRAAPGPTATAYAQLAAAERRDPGAVREVLAYPLVGAWATGCLAALRGGAAPERAGVGHLAAVAEAATRRAAGRPAPRSGTPLRRLVTEHAGLRLDVALDDLDPARFRLGLTPTGRLAAEEVAGWQDCLAAAWRLLVGRHRTYAQVVAVVLTCIVPVERDGNARGISATSADAFGAVAMSFPADPTALAVGLLHETQHSLLNAVQYLFDLHEPSPLLGYSPWRDDPRPVSGVLHGAYAYLGVTEFWRAERAAGAPVAAFEFARWRAAVLAATDGLLTDGALTAAGSRFTGAMRDRALPWVDEPVPVEVLRLATGANTDHHLRWRLRNLHVDPAAVHALAAARRHGGAPPTRPVPVTVRAAPRRLENNARLELVHRALAGGAPGAGAAPGDLAYLRGDPVAAARAYRAAIVADPMDDGAWAGLALATEHDLLRRRPELVAAVHRAVHGPAPDPAIDPDPLGTAAWLTGAG
jgi:hypothetical protein